MKIKNTLSLLQTNRLFSIYISFIFVIPFCSSSHLIGSDPLSEHSKSIIVRPAEAGEEQIMYELICELAIYEGRDLSKLPLTKENLHRFGFGKNPYFFTEFAECEGEVVGYALYFYTFSANQGYPVLYLEDLYVKREYRGLGIGSRLLKQLAKYAIEKNCCRLEWQVFTWNEPAIAFYQNLGGILRNDLIPVRLDKKSLQLLANE